MMVSDLDRRGCHQAAEQCLQTWLDFQGTVPLPGNFKSAEGVFHGAGGQESIGYNKHHGYVMWNMAEHWWYTRNRAWMERAARETGQGLRLGQPRAAGHDGAEPGRRPPHRVRLPPGRRLGRRPGLLVLAGHQCQHSVGLQRAGQGPGRLRSPPGRAVAAGGQGLSRRRDARADGSAGIPHAGRSFATGRTCPSIRRICTSGAGRRRAGFARRWRARCSC